MTPPPLIFASELLPNDISSESDGNKEQFRTAGGSAPAGSGQVKQEEMAHEKYMQEGDEDVVPFASNGVRTGLKARDGELRRRLTRKGANGLPLPQEEEKRRRQRLFSLGE